MAEAPDLPPPPTHAAAQVVGVIAGVLAGWWAWPRIWAWSFGVLILRYGSSDAVWNQHPFSGLLIASRVVLLTAGVVMSAAIVGYAIVRGLAALTHRSTP
jgi:hypothetical protein